MTHTTDPQSPSVDWPAWEGGADAVIVGAPAADDGSGTDATPAAVRAALADLSPTLLGPPALDLTDVLRIADAGDVESDGTPDEHDGASRLRDRVGELASSALVIALGGDGSITAATAQGARATGLVSIDAHLDLHDGSSLRRLIDEGVDPRRIVVIGVADFANPAASARQAAELGITVVTLDELSRRGMDEVVAQALEIAGAGDGAIVHLDVDVDACDRSVAPGTAGSVPGGLAAWELRALVRLLSVDPRVRSADIVEVDARADAPDGRTVRLAALCVLEMLAGVAGRAVSRPTATSGGADASTAENATSDDTPDETDGAPGDPTDAADGDAPAADDRSAGTDADDEDRPDDDGQRSDGSEWAPDWSPR